MDLRCRSALKLLGLTAAAASSAELLAACTHEPTRPTDPPTPPNRNVEPLVTAHFRVAASSV